MWQFARKVTKVLDASDRSDDVKPHLRVVRVAQLVLDKKHANEGTNPPRHAALILDRSRVHASLRHAAAQGLEVSLGHILQNLLLERSLRY